MRKDTCIRLSTCIHIRVPGEPGNEAKVSALLGKYDTTITDHDHQYQHHVGITICLAHMAHSVATG